MHDVLVIGAGIAGCAIATAFTRQGKRILLVERSLKEPDRIVGELLQPGGVEALTKLGLNACLDGIDTFPIKGYHIYWKDQEATFWFCKNAAETPEGRSFHHGKVVMKLREAARNEPTVTLREMTALEILRDGETGAVIGARCSGDGHDPEEYLAHLTILAHGCSSNFRSQFLSHKPETHSRFWGLEMIETILPHADYAYGILGRGSPLLIYRIGTHETRILVDIPLAIQETLGDSRAVRCYIKDRVVPTVPTAMRPGLEKALESGRLRSMPNSWLSPSIGHTAGLAMLGDAWNMRHPVTGAGMTVALKDVVLFTNMLASTPLENTDEVLRATRKFYWKRKAHCGTLNILAQALYFLFDSPDNGLEIMQYGFIRYVQGGEKNFAEPAGLMGGILESQLLLFYHFFAIALYSMRLHLAKSEIRHLHIALFQCLFVFCRSVALIAPWIAAEWW